MIMIKITYQHKKILIYLMEEIFNSIS